MKKKTVGHVKSQFSKRNRWKIEHFSQRRFLKKLNRKRNSMKDPVKSTHRPKNERRGKFNRVTKCVQDAYKPETSALVLYTLRKNELWNRNLQNKVSNCEGAQLIQIRACAHYVQVKNGANEIIHRHEENSILVE